MEIKHPRECMLYAHHAHLPALTTGVKDYRQGLGLHLIREKEPPVIFPPYARRQFRGAPQPC